MPSITFQIPQSPDVGVRDDIPPIALHLKHTVPIYCYFFGAGVLGSFFKSWRRAGLSFFSRAAGGWLLEELSEEVPKPTYPSIFWLLLSVGPFCFHALPFLFLFWTSFHPPSWASFSLSCQPSNTCLYVAFGASLSGAGLNSTFCVASFAGHGFNSTFFAVSFSEDAFAKAGLEALAFVASFSEAGLEGIACVASFSEAAFAWLSFCASFSEAGLEDMACVASFSEAAFAWLSFFAFFSEAGLEDIVCVASFSEAARALWASSSSSSLCCSSALFFFLASPSSGVSFALLSCLALVVLPFPFNLPFLL